MKKVFSPKTTKIVVLIIFIIVLLFLVNYLITKNITPEDLRQFLLSFGFLTPFIYILLTSSAVIFPFLFAPALWIAGIWIFGLEINFLYSFIGFVIGQTVNYLIAKKLGKLIVLKLSGAKALQKVDKILEILTLKSLCIFRLINGPLTDFVSYAAGFTKINLKDFIIYTTLFSLPGVFLSYLGTYFLTFHPLSITSLVFTTILIMQYSGGFIYLIYLNKKKVAKSNVRQ